MKEIWKDVKGFEGLYQVSNIGRVRSLSRSFIQTHRNGKVFTNFKPGFLLKNLIDKRGYHTVGLRYKNKRQRAKVHRLVGIAFILNPENKPQINHIDGVKTNNIVSNLEWATNAENVQHSYDVLGRKKWMLGKTETYNSKKTAQYTLNGELVKIYPSAAAAGRAFNKDKGLIALRAREGGGICYGYKWKYVT